MYYHDNNECHTWAP